MRKRVMSIFAVLCFVVMSLVGVPVAAHATSDYDDFIQVEPTLFLHTNGHTNTEKINLSDIWWEEVKQSYERRLAFNTNWPADFVPTFESIVANGGSSGVVAYQHQTGRHFKIFASADPEAYCEFTGPSTTYDIFQCMSRDGYDFVSADYITHYSYGNTCHGNTCSDNGVNVYMQPEVGDNPPSQGRIFAAHLGDVQNFWFYYLDFDTDYPTGYAGEIIPTEPPLLEYVAMGDSFSSGEGVEPFLLGSDVADDPGTTGINEENRCHRSQYAYPQLLQRDVAFNYDLDFVACSGATTSNITETGQWGKPRQLDALSETTDVVTLTIGGNDIGFIDFAKKCLSPLNTFALDEVCDEYTDVYDEVTGKIANEIPEKLESTYTAILEEAPNADIFIAGYPIIAPYKHITDPFDNDCGGLYDEIPNNWGDARAAYEVVTSLNDAIEMAVDTVNLEESSTRLHFVNVESGAFYGHDVCSGDSYFNGIDIFNPEYSIHPNIRGQQAYREDIAEELN